MPPLGVATRQPEQARDGILREGHQAGGGAHPTPVPQMRNDGRGFFLRDLRMEQRGALARRALLTAGATPEESDAVVAGDFAYGEIALAREAKPLAFTVHTR
jgi:hypothetical protein